MRSAPSAFTCARSSRWPTTRRSSCLPICHAPRGRGARYQGIHVISSHGGELLLADAHAAFDYLESVDIDAAQRLVATPVRDRERPHLPFPAVESWFRARDRFATIVRDPRHHYRVRVAQGDLVIYDSDRMLYGQTAGVDRVARVFQLTGDHEAIAPSAARSYIDEPETFFQDRSG